jgi:hypothetical protein
VLRNKSREGKQEKTGQKSEISEKEIRDLRKIRDGDFRKK